MKCKNKPCVPVQATLKKFIYCKNCKAILQEVQ